MSFRENLKDELKYQDIKVKELAFKTGINRRTIDNYLRSNESQPTAENAVKIAQVLGVTVEYLVTGENISNEKQSSLPKLDEKICKKYYSLIQKLETLPDSTRGPICKMIEELS